MTLFRPSNGVEGQFFMEDNCFGCKRYDGCEILAASFANPVEEWVYGTDGFPTCTALEEVTQ